MPRLEREDADDAIFLDPLAPPWAMRGLATLLIALFVVVLVCAAVIRLPETVTSPFVLIPVHASDPVRATRNGVVDSVNAQAGQPVEKGDSLFTVRSESQADRTSELNTLLSERDGAREALTNEIDGYASRRRTDEAELRSLQERIRSMGRQLELRREEHELTEQVAARFAKLAEKGLVSETVHANYRLQERQARRDLEALGSSLAETRTAIEKLRLGIETSEVERGSE